VSLQRPRKRSRYVVSYSKICGNDWWNRYVFSLWQKSARERDDWISGGRLFQTMDAATGNERRSTIARRYVGTCSRCDEYERSQWRPGRWATLTSWSTYGSVLETACLQLYSRLIVVNAASCCMRDLALWRFSASCWIAPQHGASVSIMHLFFLNALDSRWCHWDVSSAASLGSASAAPKPWRPAPSTAFHIGTCEFHTFCIKVCGRLIRVTTYLRTDSSWYEHRCILRRYKIHWRTYFMCLSMPVCPSFVSLQM